MPDPFFDDLEKAIQAVTVNQDLVITVERGSMRGTVLVNHADGGAIYVKITQISSTSNAENSMRVDLTKREVVS
jgi:hypothetical protein